MKKGNKKASLNIKLSEILLALVVNIKTVFFDEKTIKAGLFLILLLAGNVVKAWTEEVLAKITARPYLDTSYSDGGIQANYKLATTGSILANKLMTSLLWDDSGDEVVYGKLFAVLKEGYQIIFEDKGLQSIMFKRDRLIAIITPDETRIELTQLFSIDVIKREFPYLWEKLFREGIVK